MHLWVIFVTWLAVVNGNTDAIDNNLYFIFFRNVNIKTEITQTTRCHPPQLKENFLKYKKLLNSEQKPLYCFTILTELQLFFFFFHSFLLSCFLCFFLFPSFLWFSTKCHQSCNSVRTHVVCFFFLSFFLAFNVSFFLFVFLLFYGAPQNVIRAVIQSEHM